MRAGLDVIGAQPGFELLIILPQSLRLLGLESATLNWILPGKLFFNRLMSGRMYVCMHVL